jgi:hypothetical protein
VRARFEIRDGVPQTVDFRITSTETGRGVTASDMKRWEPVGEMALAAFYRFAKLMEHDDGANEELGAVQQTDEDALRATRSNIEAWSKDRETQLSLVAEVYRANLNGNPREAVKDLGPFSDRTASRRIEQARAAGLLPKTKQGKKKA